MIVNSQFNNISIKFLKVKSVDSPVLVYENDIIVGLILPIKIF